MGFINNKISYSNNPLKLRTMENYKMIHLHREGFDEYLGRFTYDQEGYHIMTFAIYLSHQEMTDFPICLN